MSVASCPPNFSKVIYVGTPNGLYWSGNADASSYSDVTFTIRIASPYPKKIVIDPRFNSASDSAKYIFWIGSNDQIYRSTNRGIDTSNVTDTSSIHIGTISNDLRADASDPSRLYVATSAGAFYAQLAVPPVNPTPINNATRIPVCSLTLSWGAVTGATSYHLQFGTDSTFASNLVDVNQSSISYSYGPNLTDSIKYYWRVNSTGFGTSKCLTLL